MKRARVLFAAAVLPWVLASIAKKAAKTCEGFRRCKSHVLVNSDISPDKPPNPPTSLAILT